MSFHGRLAGVWGRGVPAVPPDLLLPGGGGGAGPAPLHPPLQAPRLRSSSQDLPQQQSHKAGRGRALVLN
jgi:hypothetical protein